MEPEPRLFSAEGVAAIVIGIIVTIVVSFYFYRKSIKRKRLTPFRENFSSVFLELADGVRADLKLQFKGIELSNLFECRFIFANNGDLAITTPIDPLRVVLPTYLKVVDATVTYIHPKGREVICTTSENQITLSTKLLNPKDYFVLRILFTGDLGPFLDGRRREVFMSRQEQIDRPRSRQVVNAKEDEAEAIARIVVPESAIVDEFKFTITSEDLPPHLKLESTPYSVGKRGEGSSTLAFKTFGHTALCIALFLLVLTQYRLSQILTEEFIESLFSWGSETIIRFACVLTLGMAVWHLIHALIALVRWIGHAFNDKLQGMKFYHRS